MGGSSQCSLSSGRPSPPDPPSVPQHWEPPATCAAPHARAAPHTDAHHRQAGAWLDAGLRARVSRFLTSELSGVCGGNRACNSAPHSDSPSTWHTRPGLRTGAESLGQNRKAESVRGLEGPETNLGFKQRSSGPTRPRKRWARAPHAPGGETAPPELGSAWLRALPSGTRHRCTCVWARSFQAKEGTAGSGPARTTPLHRGPVPRLGLNDSVAEHPTSPPTPPGAPSPPALAPRDLLPVHHLPPQPRSGLSRDSL